MRYTIVIWSAEDRRLLRMCDYQSWQEAREDAHRYNTLVRQKTYRDTYGVVPFYFVVTREEWDRWYRPTYP